MSTKLILQPTIAITAAQGVRRGIVVVAVTGIDFRG
jgi:hypothetical protein